MISKAILRAIRDQLPMDVTIAKLGNAGPPAKWIEGYFRFLCPACGELRATLNPRNNLSHCFCCQRNINNIDLLMALGYDFRAAIGILQPWLEQHQRASPSPSERPVRA